jgi:hypothetical protein
VALTFLPPSVTADPSAHSRLRREAQAASACDHPGGATIYEIDHVDDQLFIGRGGFTEASSGSAAILEACWECVARARNQEA